MVTLILGTVASGPGVAQPGVDRISADTPVIRTLAGAEPHRYRLEEAGAWRISAQALERGVILVIKDEKNRLLQRTGSWRGEEGQHAAVLTTSGPVTISVEPDESHSPPGRYRLKVSSFDSSSPLYEAHLAMARGADLHLRHYYGEQDQRTVAHEQFTIAARLFAEAGRVDLQAAATYEAAYVSTKLGQHEQAADEFNQARQLFEARADFAGVARCLSEEGLSHWRMGDTDAAIGAMERALMLRETQPAAAFFTAQTLNNLGLVRRDRGEASSALYFFEKALSEWQRDADLLEDDPATTDFSTLSHPPYLKDAAAAIMNIGWAYESLGDPYQARTHYEKALGLARLLKHQRTTAKLQHNLGALAYSMGDLDAAFDYFASALEQFGRKESPNEFWAAKVHHRLAMVHRAAGDFDRARDEALMALALRREESDPVGRLETLRLLAKLDLSEFGYVDSEYLREAVMTIEARPSVPPRELGAVLSLAGDAALQAGDLADARRFLEDARQQYVLARDLRGEVHVRAQRAVIGLRQGQLELPLLDVQQAVDGARAIEDRFAEFSVLTNTARALTAAVDAAPRSDDQAPIDERRRLRLTKARDFAQQATTLSEALREEVSHPTLRRQFAATQRTAYEALVHASIALGRTDEAWAAANLARARRFSELVRRSRADFSQLMPEEVARLERLETLVAAMSERRTELMSAGNPSEAERVRSRLLAYLDELGELRQRRDGSSLAPGVESRSLAEFRSLLDEGDLLLDYFVGEAGGAVWAITASQAVFHPLPPKAALEQPVLRAARALRTAKPPPPDALVEASAMLLGPAANEIARARRVVIVPDGALQVLPFAALPAPAATMPPAASASGAAATSARSEVPGGMAFATAWPPAISYLPSPEALVSLRRRAARADVSDVVVLADPIFGQGPGRPALRRLPGTLEEAEAIRRSAPRGVHVELLLQDKASRDAVLGGALDRYRIVHFATHGVPDLQEPALAGLALSGSSATGQPETAVLRAIDVMGMSLAADLVVLSGCDTGTGRDVRGEGMLSLSRAFFYAGARQVVSSLWQVPDAPTSMLMERFYAEMLGNDAGPAEALRRAQQEVRATYPEPYNWAAFIVQGDWRSGGPASAKRTAVQRHYGSQ